MKLLVVLLVLFFIEQSECQAQSVAAFSRPDTIQAIHRLFAAKRAGARTYLNIGIPLTLIGASTAFLATTLTSTIQTGAGKDRIVPITIASGSVGLIPAGIGLIRRIRYGRKREHASLRRYEAGEPLPRWIHRRLTTRFLHS